MTAQRRPGRTGFTLIELLIVVVIIGILASVAVARFSKVRQRSQVAAVQSDLRNLAVAQERYHMANYAYTNNLGSLEFQSSAGVTITINSATNTGWGATALHAADPAIECGVYVGTADPADGAPAATAEVVECTF
jgi:prepilin-type N-terminal cleavage/methylation domain-containing protein